MPYKESLAKIKKYTRERKKTEVKEKKKAEVEAVKIKKKAEVEVTKEKKRVKAKAMARKKIKDRAAKNIKTSLQKEQTNKHKTALFNDFLSKNK